MDGVPSDQPPQRATRPELLERQIKSSTATASAPASSASDRAAAPSLDPLLGAELEREPKIYLIRGQINFCPTSPPPGARAANRAVCAAQSVELLRQSHEHAAPNCERPALTITVLSQSRRRTTSHMPIRCQVAELLSPRSVGEPGQDHQAHLCSRQPQSRDLATAVKIG